MFFVLLVVPDFFCTQFSLARPFFVFRSFQLIPASHNFSNGPSLTSPRGAETRDLLFVSLFSSPLIREKILHSKATN